MRVVILIFIVFVNVSIVFSQKVKFENTSWAKILEKSKKESKPIMVDFYATWCGPCKELDQNVYPNKKVGKYMNAHFINVKFDAESQELELVKQMGIDSYPTIIYFNSKGEEITRYMGYMEPEEFVSIAEDAFSQSKQASLQELESKYVSGERSLDLLENILSKRLKKSPDGNANGLLLDEYLQKKVQGKILNAEEVALVMNHIKSIKLDSKAYVYLKDNIGLFRAEYANAEYPDDKLYLEALNSYFAFNDIERAIDSNDNVLIEKLINEFFALTKKNSYYFIDPEFSVMDLLKPYYIKSDKAKYIAFAEKYLSKRYADAPTTAQLKTRFKSVFDYNVKNANVDSVADEAAVKNKMATKGLLSYAAEDINNTVWAVFENTEDVQALKKMLPFAKLSTQYYEKYYNLDTYAQILNKTGESKAALYLEKKAARLAKAIATEGEAEQIEEAYQEMLSAFATPTLKPMALTKTTLENHLEVYKHYNMILDFDKILDFMPPAFFESFKKENVRKSLVDAYETDGIFVNLSKTDFNNISEFVTVDNVAYTKVNMYLEMSIDLSEMLSDGTELEQQAGIINNLKDTYNAMYGKSNVSFDEDKNVFNIKSKTNMYAIGNPKNDTWKFINNEQKMKGILDEIIPEKVRETLK